MIMTTQQQAFNLYLNTTQQGDLMRWIHCAIQTQALLCLFDADDFNVLIETIKNQPYGFEPEYQKALLSLLEKGQEL